ncbi:hypothetical protein Acidovoranil_21460 [Acidovorax sp. FG27]
MPNEAATTCGSWVDDMKPGAASMERWALDGAGNEDAGQERDARADGAVRATWICFYNK